MIVTALRIIEDTELLPPIGLLFILLFLGEKTVQGHQTCRTIGCRAAMAASFVYVLWRACGASDLDARTMIGITLRGLLAAGFVAAIAWIMLPAVVHLYAFAVVALVRPANQLRSRFECRRKQRQAEYRAAAERARLQHDCEITPSDRERARLEAEEAAMARAAEQSRRQEARTACQMFYDLVAPDIGQRFTREQYEKYVQAHLGDAYSADYVERRAAQLQELLRQHVDKVAPRQFGHLDELRQWYEAETQRIDMMPDDMLKRTLQVKLKQRFSELANHLLEESKP